MVTDELAPVIPVVLSDRSGTRLAPSSPGRNLQEFLPLLSGLSSFQETVCRAQVATPEPPVVVCDVEHRGLVEDQLGDLSVTPAAIVCEPVARSTASAVAAAALAVGEARPDALLLVLSSDQLVDDVPQFVEDLPAAARSAAAGYLVAFGIAPTAPETGSGHVRRGPDVAGSGRASAADEFVEKSDLDRTRSFVQQGRWLRHSGTFLVSRRAVLAGRSTYEPSAASAAEPAVGLAAWDSSALLDLESFGTALSISLGCAEIDGTEQATVLPFTEPPSDVGAWSSLWVASDVAADDNVAFAADRDHCEEVVELVLALLAPGRTETDTSSVIRTPWGSYRSVDLGDHHQVKRIVVEPGHRLSLQRHRQRAEHWVVVQGTASIVRGDESRVLHENESVFIPVGCAHRLENPGSTPLHLVEVQVGDYLGEDDIERLADDYGRS
jgi:mannose-1-phosphate guanylyltransferase/mannose-6-phosphate isomerase